MRTLIASLVVLSLAGLPARAAERMALVIGNADYTSVPKLISAANDADDMSAMLKTLGFDVKAGINLDRRGMDEAIEAFIAGLEGSKVALFYYAGRAFEVGGRSYLVPVDLKLEPPDARPGPDADLAARTIEFDQVLQRMQSPERIALSFLDGSRDAPLNAPTPAGLGRAKIVFSSPGTLIGYATAPGSVALDGPGRNSPYTAALLKHLPTPDVQISKVMQRVRQDVTAATQAKQIPWDTEVGDEMTLVPSSTSAKQPRK